MPGLETTLSASERQAVVDEVRAEFDMRLDADSARRAAPLARRALALQECFAAWTRADEEERERLAPTLKSAAVDLAAACLGVAEACAVVPVDWSDARARKRSESRASKRRRRDRLRNTAAA